MHLTDVSIAVTHAPQELNEAARYVLYKASLLWPACFGLDIPSGDHVTHRASRVPPRLVVLRDLTEGAPSFTLSLTTEAIKLNAACQPAESAAILASIADDPIWGPDWMCPVSRTLEDLPA